jgi:hypothetical protein
LRIISNPPFVLLCGISPRAKFQEAGAILRKGIPKQHPTEENMTTITVDPTATQQHLALTALVTAVHIKGCEDRFPELIQLESQVSDAARRWAYFCAGIPQEQIEAMFALERQKAEYPVQV